MFRVIVMFIALCRLPGRWLWEACHLAGRYSWTPGMGCDVTSEWNPRRCRGSSEEGGALLGRALAAQAQAGPLLFQPGWDWAKFWRPSSYLHSVLSSSRSDFSPTAWSVHRGRHPSLHGNWRGERFLAWNDGGKQGGVGPTLWPIAGLLLGPWILRRWRKGGGPPAGSKGRGGQRLNWNSHVLIGLLQGWGSDTRPWEQVCRPSELGPHESFPLNLTVLDTVLSVLPGLYWEKNVSFPLPFPPCISHCWI